MQNDTSAIVARAQQAESLGTNIQTLVDKGVSIAEIFSVAGEFLSDSDAPDIAEANVYLLNWARSA